MENPSESTWWRSPAMIAAVIGAVAVIIAAFIGLIPKATKTSEPMRIEQDVSDTGNVQIGQARDVNVQNEIQVHQNK